MIPKLTTSSFKSPATLTIGLAISRANFFITNRSIFFAPNRLLFSSQWNNNNEELKTKQPITFQGLLMVTNQIARKRKTMKPLCGNFATFVPKSRVWFPTKLHSTQFSYHCEEPEKTRRNDEIIEKKNSSRYSVKNHFTWDPVDIICPATSLSIPTSVWTAIPGISELGTGSWKTLTTMLDPDVLVAKPGSI